MGKRFQTIRALATAVTLVGCGRTNPPPSVDATPPSVGPARPGAVQSPHPPTSSAGPTAQDVYCCVPEPDQAKVRVALVGQIKGLESIPGDDNFVRENANISRRFDEATSIDQLGEILVHERLEADRHNRRNVCEGVDDAECRSTMLASYAEDYSYGYCFTMRKPADCIMAAARGAAYPGSATYSPEERKAVKLASRAYER